MNTIYFCYIYGLIVFYLRFCCVITLNRAIKNRRDALDVEPRFASQSSRFISELLRATGQPNFLTDQVPTLLGAFQQNPLTNPQPLPPQPVAPKSDPVTELTGVNATYVSNIQQDMDKRIHNLAELTRTIKSDMKDVEEASSFKPFTGVDLTNEIVDPQDIMKQVEELEQREADAVQSKLLELSMKESLVGKQSPPIIILESADMDPLEHHLLMKLITCETSDSTDNQNNLVDS